MNVVIFSFTSSLHLHLSIQCHPHQLQQSRTLPQQLDSRLPPKPFQLLQANWWMQWSHNLRVVISTSLKPVITPVKSLTLHNNYSTGDVFWYTHCLKELIYRNTKFCLYPSSIKIILYKGALNWDLVAKKQTNISEHLILMCFSKTLSIHINQQTLFQQFFTTENEKFSKQKKP